METHLAGLTFLGVGRVSKRRVVYGLMRLIVRFTLFVHAAMHALVKGIVYFFVTLGDELVDHFNNRKYPK